MVVLTRPGFELAAENVATEPLVGEVGKRGTTVTVVVLTSSVSGTGPAVDARLWRTGNSSNGVPA